MVEAEIENDVAATIALASKCFSISKIDVFNGFDNIPLIIFLL